MVTEKASSQVSASHFPLKSGICIHNSANESHTLFDGTRIYLVLRAQTGNFGGRQPLTILIERGMTEPPLPALPIS